jgi:hypothetical protein
MDLVNLISVENSSQNYILCTIVLFDLSVLVFLLIFKKCMLKSQLSK